VAELRHTLVRAEFSADRLIRTAAGDTVNVRGNRLPYAPEQKLSALVRLKLPSGVALRVDAAHVADQYTDDFETVTPSANGPIGLIPAYTLWNAAASYTLPSLGVELFGTVKNLSDRTYVASRRPEGIEAGLPRTLQVGCPQDVLRPRRRCPWGSLRACAAARMRTALARGILPLHRQRGHLDRPHGAFRNENHGCRWTGR
jgi:hypothetical protein